MLTVQARIGSNTPLGTLQITLFVPSVDRDGRPIGQETWVEAALTTLGALFRGATAFPPGRGVWRDDARGGKLVFDDIVVITSYVDPAALTDFALASLRRLLHRIGREARQGEVGILVGAEYHGITSYDPPEVSS